MPRITIAQYLKQKNIRVTNHYLADQLVSQEQKQIIIKNHFLSDQKLSVMTQVYNQALVRRVKDDLYNASPDLKPIGIYSNLNLKKYCVNKKMKKISLLNLEQSLYQIVFEHSRQEIISSRIKRDMGLIFQRLQKRYFLKKGKKPKGGKKDKPKVCNKTQALF